MAHWGSGGAQALVCLFVAHAACLDAGGLRVLLRLYPYLLLLQGWVGVSRLGRRRLVVPFISCLKEHSLSLC